MLSIWEKNSLIYYNHIIIGSGIVGLTTAYYIQKRFPSHSVLVLERGLLPTGASTKNAGFACMGSATELLEDLHSTSEADMLELFLLRKKGLERLQTILSNEQSGYLQQGSYELISSKEENALEQLTYLNSILSKELKIDAFKRADEKIASFGFDKQHVKALIENTCEGQLDTGKLVRNLIQQVIRLGVEIKTGCNVISFEENSNAMHINCESLSSNEVIQFKSDNVCICTNAFAKTLLPELDVVAGRGQVLITKPIPNLKFKGIFHINKGYFYFREYNGCVLLGGGRNLDFETETSTEFKLNEMIQEDLIQKLKTIILPETTFKIDMQWAGIMAFGKSKQPIVKQQSERLFIGVRMGGMGVAIGSEVGFQLSNFITE